MTVDPTEPLERLRDDLRSVRLDLRILAKTAWMLATGHGLYSEDPRQGWS